MPGVQSLDGAQQVQAQAQVSLTSLEAVAEREASRLKFSGLDGEQAKTVAGASFAAVIDEPAGGPPKLPAGEKITGFANANVAQLDLGAQGEAVVESTVPMALASPSGGWAPVDLSLHEVGGAFEAANPLVAVRLPKQLGKGAQLSPLGLSVTPVDSQGVPLAGSEGVADGASAFFANTQTDSDTLLKPSARGLEVSTVLRSVESPETLYYRVDLPQGASLLEAGNGSGIIEVVKERTTIATIPAPAAQDAAGTPVPVSMAVSGSTIVLTVAHRSESLKYPVLVDPEFWEEWSNVVPGNWEFHEWVGYKYGKAGEELWMEHPGPPSQENDYGNWSEWTKGYTKIYEVYIKDSLYPIYESSENGYLEGTEPFLLAGVEIFSEGWKEGHGEKHYQSLNGDPYRKEATVCVNTNCSPESTSNHNAGAFNITTTHTGFFEETFGGRATQISTAIAQEKGQHSTVAYNSTLPEVEIEPSVKTPNVFYGGGRWIGPHSGGFEFVAEDGGLGVSETKVEYKATGGWESRGGTNYLKNAGCVGIQCATAEHEIYSYNSLTGNGTKPLAEPEAHVRVAAKSYMPYTTSSEYGEGEAVLKVDKTLPRSIVISGLAGKGEEYELGEVETHVKVEATDGEGAIPSAGIKEIELGINGKRIGSVGGYCTPGPCTASNEWAINGAELGAGIFILTAVATDNAGNKKVSSEYRLTVHHASPVAMGPGSVNPESGDFAMQASDVDLSGGMGSLTLGRHYDSRNLQEGIEGPLGPQWTISLGSLATLEVLPDGSVMIVGSNGLSHFPVKKGGGGFEAPPGDTNLKLEYESKKNAYILKNEAQKTTTEFTLPAGTKTWMPTISQGAVATDTMTDEYASVETESKKMIVEPIMELAPHPSASCAREKMEAGCRALEFKYGKETTAKGEAKSEWGEYKNRLKEVLAVAYNPSTKKMATTPVAQYEYDLSGRLRAEWDPRISPAVKTFYGYDAEGHVTALTPPGQESWAFTYGTIQGDSSTGRMLKVMRAPASTLLWKGESPKNSVAPKLSGSAVVGTKMGVSTGTWSNEPATYAYQWNDCGIGGGGCTPILGATNANYTLTTNDANHTVMASVTAVNGGGSVVANTSASSLVLNIGGKTEGEYYAPRPGWTIEYQVPLTGTGLSTMTKTEVEKWGQKDDPENAAAIFPPDEPMGWPATSYKRATVYYMDSYAHTVNVATPPGAISTTEFNQTNNTVERTLSPDNRVAALKEGSKSAEVSKLLDTKSVYNTGGTQVLETRGPQHAVKLAAGTEVQARNHARYFYDENAPSGEMFDLVTRTTDGAEYEGKEADVRETRTSYSGQKGLGWKLRKPTSVMTDPAGLDLTKTTVYDENAKGESSGSVVETKAPVGTSEMVAPLSYSLAFGSEGSGTGQFVDPQAVAVDASANVWVDDRGNSRIEKFSSTGTFIGAYGSKGTGALQFSSPWGIAVNQATGNVYVEDTGNNRIEVLSSSGAFVDVIGWGVSDGKAELEVCTSSCKAGILGSGNGQFDEPSGLTIDSQGDVLVADEANDRVEVLSATGSYLTQFGSKGSGSGQLIEPSDVAISEGEVYVVDYGNNRVEEFSPSGAYLGEFGTAGAGPGQFKEPIGIAVNQNNGSLYVSDSGHYRIEEFSPAGKFLTEFGTYGTGKGQFHTDEGVAIGATGNLYVADEYNARIQQWLPPGTGGAHMIYSTQFGSAGSGEGQFNHPLGSAIDGHGNVWASDANNHRIQEFSGVGKPLAAYGSYGTGNGQFEQPIGLDINQSTGNVYIADCADNRIQELSSTGEFIRTFGSHGTEQGQFSCPSAVKIDTSGNVWDTDSGNNRIEKFSATGTFIEAIGWGVSNSEAKLEVCTASCKAGIAGSGNGQFHEPGGLTFSGSNLYVADYANNRVEELSSTGSYLSQFGSPGNGGGQFKGPEPIATDAAGNVYVVDTGQDRVEEFSASGTFIATFGSQGNGEGQLADPEGISINSAGDVYISDATNNRIEEWVPANQAAHDTQTIYYTPKTEATVPACQNHPEWANLPCQTQPTGQPETSGLPNLPVTDITYNMWDQAETITETFGSTTRTRKNTFDNAGRPLTSEETSAVDKAFPKVTDEYNKETGALEKESTTVEGKTKTITKIINARGQLTSYTDADGATTKYTYDMDGRTEEVSDSKGYQIYAYDPTTGFLNKLLDSAAGTFTASYDVQGKMLTESYPNGMNANYIISPAGQDTKVEYLKTTHCTTGCTWFSDAAVPSIHGEMLAQTSTLSGEAYSYDNTGRLLQTQETPAGKGCVTRIYAYDEESNRRSFTTREPGSKGECVTEGGTVERHIYDPANRLIDSGVSYEALGNTTNLPASDAGGGNELTSSYYVDSQVASQTQNGETISYNYDPAARTRETVSSGKTSATIITHYDGPGNALSWTSESTEKWTRNIPGIGGEVTAIQTNSGTPVLQLHDLNGNIVATAALNETETKLLTTYNSTEFGVPTTSNPPKYSWLGADGIASELPSGDITQDGNTYIPLTGQPLQTQPVELPLPINTITPFTDAAPPWVGEQAGLSGAEEIAAANEAKKAVEGPIEDPIDHYRAWEAEQKSEQLLRLVAAGDLTEALGALFGTLADYVDGYILAKGLTEIAFTWLEEFGQFLGACVRELRANKDSHGGCRASYSDILSLPDFWIKPEISYCLDGKYESGAIDGLGLHKCTLLVYASETTSNFT
ncbi:MAG TPA: 6-bladed beta-propeller [Solirubrobacteraceae bacterium]